MKSSTQKPRSRHHGGQELPDDVQDRPEQNAGYDQAVRGGSRGTRIESHDDAEVIDLEEDIGGQGIRIEGEEGKEGEEG